MRHSAFLVQVEQLRQARLQAEACKEQHTVTHLHKTVLMGFERQTTVMAIRMPIRIDI